MTANTQHTDADVPENIRIVTTANKQLIYPSWSPQKNTPLLHGHCAFNVYKKHPLSESVCFVLGDITKNLQENTFVSCHYAIHLIFCSILRILSKTYTPRLFAPIDLSYLTEPVCVSGGECLLYNAALVGFNFRSGTFSSSNSPFTDQDGNTFGNREAPDWQNAPWVTTVENLGLPPERCITISQASVFESDVYANLSEGELHNLCARLSLPMIKPVHLSSENNNYSLEPVPFMTLNAG